MQYYFKVHPLLMLMLVPTQPVLHVQNMQGGTGGPLAASEGVTDSLQLNHSRGRLSAWQDKAKCPSHLLCHL